MVKLILSYSLNILLEIQIGNNVLCEFNYIFVYEYKSIK